MRPSTLLSLPSFDNMSLQSLREESGLFTGEEITIKMKRQSSSNNIEKSPSLSGVATFENVEQELLNVMAERDDYNGGEERRDTAADQLPQNDHYDYVDESDDGELQQGVNAIWVESGEHATARTLPLSLSLSSSKSRHFHLGPLSAIMEEPQLMTEQSIEKDNRPNSDIPRVISSHTFLSPSTFPLEAGTWEKKIELVGQEKQSLTAHHQQQRCTDSYKPQQEQKQQGQQQQGLVEGRKTSFSRHITKNLTKRMNRAAFRMKLAVSRGGTSHSNAGAAAEVLAGVARQGGGGTGKGGSISHQDSSATPTSITSMSITTDPTFSVVEQYNYSKNGPTTTETTSRTTSEEDVDISYDGPYDDNRSLITYSTGDFDSAQLMYSYSRSWSSSATLSYHCTKSIVTSDATMTATQNNTVVSIDSNEEITVSAPIYDAGVQRWMKHDEVKEGYSPHLTIHGGQPILNGEKGEAVNLDGLSLVGSVVGDDRSYVEDY